MARKRYHQGQSQGCDTSNSFSVCPTAADRTSVHVDQNTGIICHIPLTFQVGVSVKQEQGGKKQFAGDLGGGGTRDGVVQELMEMLHGWSESQRKVGLFPQGQESKGFIAELEKMSTFLKTYWLHTPLLKGCVQQEEQC